MIFWVALHKELLEQWRSYRLLIVAVVLTIFGLLSPLTAKYTPELMKLLPNGEAIAALIPPPTVADSVTQYLKNISQFSIILALLVTMGAVAHEKERGTAGMMLVKPLPRWAFLAAKFAALSLTFAASLTVAGAGCYYYTLILFEPLRIGAWVVLNLLVLVFVLVYIALTLMSSVLTKSQAAAGGLAFALLMALAIPGALPKVGEYLPGQLINWGAGFVMESDISAWPALWVSIAIIVAALGIAWLAFERQEL